MVLACLFVDDSPLAADFNRITVVTLDWRHEFDPAVAVLVVVPIDERGRFKKACTCRSMSAQMRLTWDFEIPLLEPRAATSASTLRVETPAT